MTTTDAWVAVFSSVGCCVHLHKLKGEITHDLPHRILICPGNGVPYKIP